VDLFRMFRRGEAKPAAATVDVKAAFEQLQADKQAQFVDVREPREWAATGVPKKAKRIPLGALSRRAPSELIKVRPVFVICNSGNRSRNGAKILMDLGYTQVFNVAGGMQAWLRAGLPVNK
jgi:rhodanese-related sulfurtransferase